MDNDEERDNVIRLVANMHDAQPPDPDDTSELDSLIEDVIALVREEGYTTGVIVLMKGNDYCVVRGHSIGTDKYLSLLQRIVTEEIVLTSKSLR